jgi:uncharacterized protein YwgA
MHKRFIPLALTYLDDEEPIEGRTRLQKMVFVVQQELMESGHLREDQLYEFFAYDYGPFSKELAESVDQMIEDGLLDETEVVYDDEGNVKYIYEIEPDGREVVERESSLDDIDTVVQKAHQIKQRFNDNLSLPEVIDEVYAEYPEYAEESVY